MTSTDAQSAIDLPIASKDEKGQLSIGACLKLIEHHTGRNGPFWRERLNLGESVWRQWRLGRNPGAVLKNADKIRHVLLELGYEVPKEFLINRSVTEAEFISNFVPTGVSNNQIINHDQLEWLDDYEPNLDLLIDSVARLAPVGRAEGSARIAMIISPNLFAVRTFLVTWLRHPSQQPIVPWLHFDAARYPDAPLLLSRIVEHLDPASGRQARTPLEQVKILRERARSCRFVLIIDNIDCYADRKLFPKGDSFRLGSLLVEKIVFGCFGMADPVARLVLTAKQPLHAIDDPNLVIEIPNAVGSATDEARFQCRTHSDACYAELSESIAALCDAFPPDIGGEPFVLRLKNSNIPESGKRTDSAIRHLAVLPPQGKILLRLIAASTDGLRKKTLQSLIHRIGGETQQLLGDEEKQDQTMAYLYPLLVEVQERVFTEVVESAHMIASAQLCNDILQEWERADPRGARRVYLLIGVLALERAESEEREGEDGHETRVVERLVQAAHALLASVDPKDERGGTVTWPSDRSNDRAGNDKAADLRRRILDAGDLPAIDVVRYVLRGIWRRKLESRGAYRFVRRHGLVETKLYLLLHFINTGTATHLDETSASEHFRNGRPIPFLNNEDEVDLRVALAITAAQAGRHYLARIIAESAKGWSSKIREVYWRRRAYKVLVDTLIRHGDLRTARDEIEEALYELCKYGSKSGAHKEINALALSDPQVVGALIDFLCRRGEINVLEGLLAEARTDFDEAVKYSARAPLSVSGGDQFASSNGRRYINHLIISGVRHQICPARALGEAVIHLERCKQYATHHNYEHDLAALSVDEARLLRISCNNRELHLPSSIELVDRALDRTLSYGVSRLVYLEALAEKAKLLFLLAHRPRGATNQRLLESKQLAAKMYDESRSLRLPVFEAEALLLLCEIDCSDLKERLGRHDAICQEHGIRIFDHPRSLLIHDVKPTLCGAW